ncbi:hypothetical protein [Pontivivens ytuae]|uniref:Uncharacterized protein n=1 Tax=Pontivivens ytuae TaxID=2789856 RepID=A0A7S9QED5_9RHOB|nr:hypothetical protein [Pontivivens ytuae]QPH55943.1 hypothetical protein I0K15_09535 [Pontivivens ytuae]QPH55958.1 hypothetical protein I0K15_09615 [Pontivivens ytuae]
MTRTTRFLTVLTLALAGIATAAGAQSTPASLFASAQDGVEVRLASFGGNPGDLVTWPQGRDAGQRP